MAFETGLLYLMLLGLQIVGAARRRRLRGAAAARRLEGGRRRGGTLWMRGLKVVGTL